LELALTKDINKSAASIHVLLVDDQAIVAEGIR